MNVHCSLHSAAERGRAAARPGAELQKLFSPAHAGTNYELSTSSLLGAMQRQACCASLCTFRTAAPKMRIKTFAGNIEQGRPLPMILDPKKTRGISVMLVSEAGCCTIAHVPHSLADDFEVLLDLEPSPCQHRPHRPSLARGSAPTPSPLTCPVHSSHNS